MFRSITVQSQFDMKVESFVNGAGRMIKAFRQEAKNGQHAETHRHLCKEECAERAEEMWEALRYQYSVLIGDGKTVKELHIQMTTTTFADLGSLNKTRPPLGSIIDRLRNKGQFRDVNQVRWSRKPIEGQEITRESMAEMQDMIVELRSEMVDLGYALRRHNWRHRDSPENQVIRQSLFQDWVDLKYNLPLERAAAVTHLQTMVMLSSLLHAWLRNFRLKQLWNPMVGDIERVMARLVTEFDAPEDTWALGGYHIMMADNGAFNDVNDWHTAFSHMRNYLTTTTATQSAQGTTVADHIRDWNVSLLPQDALEVARPSTAEPKTKAMPKRLVAKPMPRPGDTSSSAGHTGARPKAKSRPSQRGGAPHWVIPALPIGFIEKTAENKDYPCGSNVRTRYWMERDGEMSCYRLGRGQLATPQTSTLGSNT